MRTLRSDGGFTLVELLVAMVASMLLFGATLTVLDVFARSSVKTQQHNDANNGARLAVDRVVRQLRNISSPAPVPELIERATPFDLVFQTIATPSGSNTTGIQRVRYCIPADTPQGSSATEVLIAQTQTWSTAAVPANPWPQAPASIACPDSSQPSSIQASSVTNRFGGRADRPAFTFNGGPAPGDPTTVISVQADLFVNPAPARPLTESEIRSAAFLRNQNRAPSASYTYTLRGGGSVLLNGATSYDPDGRAITYNWSCTAPSPCSNSATLSNAQTGLVDWTPGTGAYTVTLTVTDPTGLAATSTQQVNVA